MDPVSAIDSTSIPILLVEDSLHDAEIIKKSLQKNGLKNSIHHAIDGQEAVDFLYYGTIKAGVLILDIHLPKLGGIDVLKVAKKIDPNAVVIMLTGRSSLETAVQSLRHEGAFDYIEKSKDDLPQLVEAVRLAVKKRALSLKTMWPLQSDGINRLVDTAKIEQTFRLSKREIDVLKCLFDGGSNRNIAERLLISELTVKVHLKKIYEKMKVHSRTTLFSNILSSTRA